QEAELKPATDHLPEEPGVVERSRLDLIDHDRAVPEKVDNDVRFPEGRGLMAARVRLSDAVVRQIALLIHKAEEERLPDRGRFLCSPEEFRQIEHRALAQRAHPILARRLLRCGASRGRLEIDGSLSACDGVAAGPRG